MSNPRTALEAACRLVGIDFSPAEVIRAGENTLYRLPGCVVARVTRPGPIDVARKEVQVSGWLRHAGVPVVEALPTIKQPVAVAGRAVTFWRELPPHSRGGIEQVADILRRIHHLRVPDTLVLPPLAPFVRLDQRLADAATLNRSDRDWLQRHLDRLRQQYTDLPAGLPMCAIHGDAYGGNVVSTANGPVVLDLERFAYGPPEWDLVSVAVEHDTFGTLATRDWQRFCTRYGHDVTTWTGYELLRDIRELRKVTFAVQMADQHPHVQEQAQYRMACIRGERGPRPWHWRPVP